MIIFCPAIGDDHAAGPHRIVIPQHVIHVSSGKRGNAVKSVKLVTGPEFVVCAMCDHWVKRVVQHCSCFCHVAE